MCDCVEDAIERWITVFHHGGTVVHVEFWREDGVGDEREGGPCCEPRVRFAEVAAVIFEVACKKGSKY